MAADDVLLPRQSLYEGVVTWQDERMTLTPRQRRHTKSSANSKHPIVVDEEVEAFEWPIVLLDSTTTLKTPDVVAKMTALDILDEVSLRRSQLCQRWGGGWGRDLPETYCILGGIFANRPTGLNHTGKAKNISYNPVNFVHS